MLNVKLRKTLRDFSLNIDLDIAAKTLALIGHSGCGKTTALQLLAGLSQPDEGRIALNGAVLLDSSAGLDVPAEERRIGYVFQSYALFPHLTVADNIAYGIRQLPRGEQADRVNEMLEMMQLAPLAGEKPGALSGGQQQRVALARALATRPRLLLLDEPLSALDVSTRGHVRTELKRLLDTLSMPCILVTHDYEDARVLGDEIAVMDRGRIVQRGQPAAVARCPANRFVAAFTGTNLVTEAERTGGHGRTELRQIAFDPWKATVSKEAGQARYQWCGIVEDKSMLGGFVRLAVRCGRDLLVADLRVEDEDRAWEPDMGAQVYVQAGETDVRRYAVQLPCEFADADADEASSRPEAADRPVPEAGEAGRRMAAGQSGPTGRRGAAAGRETQLWRPASGWRRLGTPIVAVFWLVLAVGIFAGIELSHSADANAAGGDRAAAAKQVKMTAFIAANATDPFNAVIQAFEERHPGITVEPSYAGTQVLQTQLEQGASVDLFLSANQSHADAIVKEGLVGKFYPVSKGHEVIIVPKANPAGIHSLHDLGTKPLKLIIGVNSVPIGQYSRQVFKNADANYGAGFSDAVLRHVVSMETNVKQILEKVSLGEGDAGIVYQTDVTPDFAGRLTIIQIPAAMNVIATNYAGVPKRAPHPQLARLLLAFIRSPEGQAAFRKLGYDALTASSN